MVPRARALSLFALQDVETNQLIMTPGGFYSGFLINTVRFGDAKALCLALLRAAKMHCAAISSAIKVQMAGQQGILHECDWPAGRITPLFLFGSSLAASLHGEVSNVLAGGSEAMKRRRHRTPIRSSSAPCPARMPLGGVLRPTRYSHSANSAASRSTRSGRALPLVACALRTSIVQRCQRECLTWRCAVFQLLVRPCCATERGHSGKTSAARAATSRTARC